MRSRCTYGYSISRLLSGYATLNLSKGVKGSSPSMTTYPLLVCCIALIIYYISSFSRQNYNDSKKSYLWYLIQSWEITLFVILWNWTLRLENDFFWQDSSCYLFPCKHKHLFIHHWIVFGENPKKLSEYNCNQALVFWKTKNQTGFSIS